MTRPWRIEYEGAIYHVLSRGNERRDIFYDKQDRDIFGLCWENRLWEDFRHGLVLGARDFVDELRMKYLPGKPHQEVPQQKRVAAEIDLQDLLKRVSDILKCDPVKFKQSKRLSSPEKEDRDLLFFLIWNTGRFTNRKIGDLFDLTYSSVSHSIKSVKLRIKEDQVFQKKIETINSQIKM